MLRKLRGTAEFSASGAFIYNFINSIRDNNIVCMSQKINNGVFYGCVYGRDIKAVTELAEENRIDIEFTSRKGLPFKLGLYRFRFGIAAGLLVLAVFVFYISNIVVSVEVMGNSGVSSERIISALAETGIYKGRFIADINFRSCEHQLRLSVPELAWAGIRHTGSRIVVEVTEADPPPEMIRDDIPCNIVSDKDAVISEIEVYSGRKMKQNGAAVKKGDIIISGIVVDDGGHILKKHAMGKIIGTYEECVSFVQPLSEESQVYTGDTVTKKYLDFFGFRIPLFLKNAEYASCDYSETVNNFMLLGKRLPLGIIHSTYSPFEYKALSYSADEADILLQQKLSLYEKNFYDAKNITVKDRKIEVKNYSDRMEYTATYVLEGEIGYDYEIYVN